MLDRMIDTDTTLALKEDRTLKRNRPYIYSLTERQVEAVRRNDLPDSALAALAAIAGATYATRGDKWVVIQARTLDCFKRSYRWWHRATTALEKAGLIECERHAGRLPRYRLTPQRKRATASP